MEHELWNHGITDLKKNLCFDPRFRCSQVGLYFQKLGSPNPNVQVHFTLVPISGNSQTPTHKVDIKDKDVKSNTEDKSTERDFFKFSPIIKCYKCQGYGYVAANYSSPVKVAIDKELCVTNSVSDSGEVTSQEEQPAHYNSDKETKSDDIEKSCTLILPENTSVIAEFTDVFPKNSTLIPP